MNFAEILGGFHSHATSCSDVANGNWFEWTSLKVLDRLEGLLPLSFHPVTQVGGKNLTNHVSTMFLQLCSNLSLPRDVIVHESLDLAGPN